MALWDIFKVSRKTFVNPTEWIGAREIETNSKATWTVIKGIITRPAVAPEAAETYEQALQRLNLTDEDVQKTAETYRKTAYIFLSLGILVFFYAFYLLFRHFLLSGLCLGLAATSLFLAQAFKYHFWSFQMKNRKLGATFADWKRGVMGH